MSGKLGGYFADRGGMFMAATLRSMARVRLLRVVEVKQLYQVVDTPEGKERVTAGFEHVDRVDVCRLPRRDIHMLSVGGSLSERMRDGRRSR